MAGAFEARKENLVQVLSTGNGKIVRDAAFEVSSAAPMLRFYAAFVLTDVGRPGERQPR
jgi:acyl-CoA reductase-like NAD-dependent aldehyde dehydrogenase